VFTEHLEHPEYSPLGTIVDFSGKGPNYFFQVGANRGETLFCQLESRRKTFF